ncbi:sulfotransferase domain-containing protein [Paraliomyxa miuraensis]|uniref:sulfotransferase domain-containing protein n=1 Tax=Paraliomyxa miuraensis TaxID=376150 RepID=UPI00225A83DF|nr:sulfotransferase domain-containing protein [Paraliomyxa miuraensis]MCX4242197.1 sulfotransferase domain-containing protein [Paraliomyxa miuraensis]
MIVKLVGAVGYAGALLELLSQQIFLPRRIPRALRGYEPTEHDVFVAVYPKSGTNWAMQIAQQIAYRGAAEFDHIHDLVPWPEAPFPNIVPMSDRSIVDRCPTGLRVIKTHLLADHVPFSPRARYITVIRDPKEVLVSSYHFFTGVFGLGHRISAQEWFRRSTKGGPIGRMWAEHAAGHWARRERPNVLVLTYGEMKADLEGSVSRFAELMGVSLSDEQFAEVVRRASFPYMKAHDDQFGPPRLPLTRRDQVPPMVRRGVAGDSGEMLDADQRALVDRQSRAFLAELGSDLPYDELFGPRTDPRPE